jgi:hypothetical protein
VRSYLNRGLKWFHTSLISATREVKISKGQPRWGKKKKLARPHLNKYYQHGGHVCKNPSYMGGIDRRITVHSWPWVESKTRFKIITKAKRAPEFKW